MSYIDQTVRRHTARLHACITGTAPRLTLPTFSTLHRSPALFMQGFFWAGHGETDLKGLPTERGRTLPLASEVSDHCGEVVEEVLHPCVFSLGLVRLKPLEGLIIKNLASAPGRKKLLWSGHVMCLLKEPLCGLNSLRRASYSIGRPKLS